MLIFCSFAITKIASKILNMAVTIKRVSTKRDLKRFIRFNYEQHKQRRAFVKEIDN